MIKYNWKEDLLQLAILSTLIIPFVVFGAGRSEVASPTITSSGIPTDAVTTDKIKADSVTSTKILNGAVTTGKIAGGAVTTPKLHIEALMDATKSASVTVLTVAGASNFAGDMKNTDATGARFCLDETSANGEVCMYQGVLGAWTDLVYNVDRAKTDISVLNANGNVGIGTVSPATTLQVVGDAEISGASTFLSSVTVRGDGTATNLITAQHSNASGKYTALGADNTNGYLNTSGALSIRTLAASDIIFSPNASERMRLEDSGQLTVGAAATKSTFTATGLLNTNGACIGAGCTAYAGKLSVNSSETDGAIATIFSNKLESGNRAALFLIGSNANGMTGNASIESQGINNQQTEMIFRTGAADSTSFGTERMRITTEGQIGIGEAEPAATLEIKPTDVDAYTLQVSSQNGTAVMVVDRLGNVGIGDASPGTKLTVLGDGTFHNADDDLTADALVAGPSKIATVQNNSAAGINAQHIAVGANANPSSLFLVKTRSNGTDADTIVADDDALGSLIFRGADGAAYRSGAAISAYVDGTPGSADMPTRLEFGTTADGAASPTTRMTILEGGNVGIGTDSPASKFHVEETAAAVLYTTFEGPSAQYRWKQDNASDALSLETDDDKNGGYNTIFTVQENTLATTFSGELVAAGDSITVATAQSPAATDACTTGEIAWDASYVYICTASTVWKRAALTGGY